MSGSFHIGAALTGLVVMVVGFLFLLEALDIADLRFEVVLPAAAVALGVAIVLSSLAHPRDGEAH